MDEHFKLAYVREIQTQCEFAINSLQSLNQIFQQMAAPENKMNMELANRANKEVFRQIHSFLTHASNVSRIFWPPIPKQKENENDAKYKERIEKLDRAQRAVAIRNLYEIKDNNCLKNRTLRDHLEHYDERLDDWRKNSARKNIVSDFIGPKNMIVGIDETDMMRHYDPTIKTFHFRGENFNLQEIATAIDSLIPQSIKIEKELRDKQIENFRNRMLQNASLPQTPTHS